MRVPSTSQRDVWYELDLELGTCTCPGWQFRHTCKHLRSATMTAAAEILAPYQGETIEYITPEARLYAAIAKMQAGVGVAIKDTEGQIGQNRNYKYADLAAVWEAAREPLSENDLAVVQLPGMYDGHNLSLTTIIVHKDGGSLSGTMSVPVSKADAQGCGSALTYMRRYALAAALGITQEDDDGNAASTDKRDTTPRQNTPARAPQRPTEQVASAPVQHSASPTNGNSWGQLTELMRENKIGKAWVEPIIGGFSADILTAWLAAEEGRSVQEVIATAVTKKGS